LVVAEIKLLFQDHWTPHRFNV